MYLSVVARFMLCVRLHVVFMSYMRAASQLEHVVPRLRVCVSVVQLMPGDFVPCPDCPSPDEDPRTTVYPCPSCGGQGWLLDLTRWLPHMSPRVFQRWKSLVKRLRWRTKAQILFGWNGHHQRYMRGPPDAGVRESWQPRGFRAGVLDKYALGLWGWLVWKRLVRIRMQQARLSKFGHALKALKELRDA